MKTENKYTKQLITNCVLKALRGSTTPNKPVLRFPQDKFNSSSFFSVYQNTKEKSRGRLFRWQIGPLQAEGGSYFTHGDGGAPGPVGLEWTSPPSLLALTLVRPRPASVPSGCKSEWALGTWAAALATRQPRACLGPVSSTVALPARPGDCEHKYKHNAMECK